MLILLNVWNGIERPRQRRFLTDHNKHKNLNAKDQTKISLDYSVIAAIQKTVLLTNCNRHS